MVVLNTKLIRPRKLPFLLSEVYAKYVGLQSFVKNKKIVWRKCSSRSHKKCFNSLICLSTSRTRRSILINVWTHFAIIYQGYFLIFDNSKFISSSISVFSKLTLTNSLSPQKWRFGSYDIYLNIVLVTFFNFAKCWIQRTLLN